MFAKSIVTKVGDVFRDEYSLAFDGSNDYVEIPSTTYDVDGGTVSFTFWAKRDDISVQNIVMGNHHNYSFINLHSNANMYIESDTNDDLASAPITNDTNWHHYVITCNSGTVAMYEDGISLTMGDSSIGDDITISKISINTAKVFNGNISEIAIYNSVLTASQVKTIYNGREPYNHKEGVASGNLQGWWRMGDGSLDESGFKDGVIGNEKNNTLGTNLVANGTMEADSNWADYNSVNANVRSTTQVYEGTYSRKFTVDGSSQGIQSDNFTTETNKTYYVTFQIYPDDATTARIAIRKGDNSDWANDTAFSGLTQDAWNKVSLAYTDTAGGSGAYLVIHGHGNTSGDFYIDNAKIQKMGDGAGCLKNMGATNIEGDTP